jgi:transcriptional regulator with XRE-family HTH domain
VERGWNAKGLLRPHWERLPGKRDELARLTGIGPQTLSGYNSGQRRLGIGNAQRIAEALGITVLDLGAPTTAQVAERSAVVLDRLETLEARQAALLREIAELRAVVDELRQHQGGEG